MTSLTLLPPLQRTITDIMDDDLYIPQSPSGAASTSVAASPAMVANSASTTLLKLLNVPESFVEHYTRVNGSNNAVNNIPSLFLDSSTEYSTYDADANKVNPFNSYANPDTLSGQQQQQQQQQQALYAAFVQPELIRKMPTRRITTLGDHSMTKSVKDEDYYLFNTNIQPSQMMANRNYFNTEDYQDNLFFIMNGDLDVKSPDSQPVPGYENDYLMEFEDAEEFDDLSDDDNYFQDDNDDMEDMDTYMIDSAASDRFIPLSKVPSEGFMQITSEKDDMMVDDDVPELVPELLPELVLEVLPEFVLELLPELILDVEPESVLQPVKQEESNEPTSIEPVKAVSLPSLMHLPEEYHQTAAEITANNPNHECDLLNPSTGRPCNKQFSRPYDLIRHQETIHASKKKIFRCVICEGRLDGGPGNGKLKTFSRGDALSRHIKVKHGINGQEAVDLITKAKENVEFVLV